MLKANSSKDNSFIREIDPLALDLNPENKKLLLQLFEQNPGKIYFNNNKTYWLQHSSPHGMWQTPIKLSYAILRARLSAGVPNQHITIIAPPFGEGGYDTTVSEVEIEVSLADEKLNYQLIPHAKVVKIQNLEKYNNAAKSCARYTAEKEAFIGHQLPHLQTRLILNQENVLISIMNFLGKTELFKLIYQDFYSPMPFPHRLALTFAILYAYKNQVEAKGLVHHDIKPENIMIKQNSGNFSAYFIDYAHAYLISHDGTKELRPGGSINFRAPEVLRTANKEELISIQSDIFSLGRVLTQLFRPENTSEFMCATNTQLLKRLYANSKTTEKEDYKQRYPRLCQALESDVAFIDVDLQEHAWEFILDKQHPLNTPLFHNIKDEITPEIQTAISDVILQMVSYEKEQRPSIDAVIESFLEISRLYHDTPIKQQSTVYPAVGNNKACFFPNIPTVKEANPSSKENDEIIANCSMTANDPTHLSK